MLAMSTPSPTQLSEKHAKLILSQDHRRAGGRAQTHRLGLMTALDRSSTSICGQGTKPLTYPFPYPKITKLCQLLVYPKGIQHVSRKPLVVTSVQGKMITTQNMPHSILASTGMSETILHIDRTPRSQPASQYRDAKTGDPICPDELK